MRPPLRRPAVAAPNIVVVVAAVEAEAEQRSELRLVIAEIGKVAENKMKIHIIISIITPSNRSDS